MLWHTALTRRLGLRYPIIAAPLGRGSTPDFLAALAREGAMGFVAIGHMPETALRQTLSSFVAATGGTDRFGINLVLIVDQMRRLDSALAAGCRFVSLLRGDPAPYARRAKDAGATVFWTVSGPAEAQRAADLGVDFMALLPAIVDAARGVPVVAAGWYRGWPRAGGGARARRVRGVDGHALQCVSGKRQPFVYLLSRTFFPMAVRTYSSC